MWNTENDIRVMAKKFPNTYSVCVYACCREIYSTKRHTGHVGGTEEEAKAQFMLILTEEFNALEAKDATDKEIKALKSKVEQQAALIDQIHAQDDEKPEKISK